MKKFMLVSVCIMMSAALAQAQGLKLGGHGAYTVGGDVEEEEAGFGAQVGIEFNESFSMEVSGTKIEDEVGHIDVDIFTIALSARVGGEVADGLTGYLGGGVNYNTIEIDEMDDPDDEVGFHACAGIEIALGENLELFAEYRYSWVEYTAESGGGSLEIEETDEDYEFGLARAGINILL